VLAITVIALVSAYLSYRENRGEIITRYAEIRAALSKADTNAVVALIAPAYRSSFDGALFFRLDAVAQTLGTSSKVLVFFDDATVWPKPNWYLCGMFPIGDTVEMTKINGHWFFTGKVHLD
jgi:hypothetical protein